MRGMTIALRCIWIFLCIAGLVYLFTPDPTQAENKNAQEFARLFGKDASQRHVTLVLDTLRLGCSAATEKQQELSRRAVLHMPYTEEINKVNFEAERQCNLYNHAAKIAGWKGFAIMY